MRARPIGVFDSGMGGLSVLAELRRALPGEHFVYLADTAHVPYGSRSDDEVRRLTATGLAWLREQGCRGAVVACNTASAFSLDFLRARFGPDFPIVGLVPALKPAVAATRSGTVAVLATPVTLRGEKLAEVTRQFAVPAGVAVLHLSHPELVPLVEAGQADSARVRAVLREVLTPAAEAGADQLVLGCTHFPFLVGQHPGRVRRSVRAARFRSGGGAAHGAGARNGAGAANTETPGADGQTQFFVTGDPAQAAPVMAALTGQPVRVEQAEFALSRPPPVAAR